MRSVILLGGPDSGKTNYVARLWPALDEGRGELTSAQQPDDISFVLEVAEHLLSGHFAPRSEHTEARRDFRVEVARSNESATAAIVVPDISGELWRKAVSDCELPIEWMNDLKAADGALLFVRVGSDQDIRPLDWVTSRDLLGKLGTEDDEPSLAPTQVMLCELVRFLEVSLASRADGERPRLSVVVAAWDRADEGLVRAGPKAYLENEYPLLAGKLRNLTALDVRVFGLSIVGGDLQNDDACREGVQEHGLDGRGWVAVEREGGWEKDGDVTLPIAWVVGV